MATEQRVNPNESIMETQSPGNGQSTASSYRKLYRHPADKRLGGVCGGLGEYFNIDPVLLRLAMVLLTIFTGGIAILGYGILWILLPEGTQQQGETEAPAIKLSNNSVALLAWVLIGLGVLWLLANTGILGGLMDVFGTAFSVLFWPAVLIVAGLFILRSVRGNLSFGKDVKERVPDGESVKQGLNDARQRVPLKRSRDDRMLLGVCGGIARWLKIDPAIVRILYALFSIGSMGTGVILYVIMALIMPEEEMATAVEVVDAEVLDPIS
ncbi:MAG: PspC domain-containing protein [Caldilineales bacterium]|nr:PspC domain-containing protein [Caldilineales bacterium]